MKTFALLSLLLFAAIPFFGQKTKVAPVAISADELLDTYRFEEAAKQLQKDLQVVQKAKGNIKEIQAKQELARKGVDMLHAVERVVVIDSFVVAKDLFFATYRLSESCGSVAPYYRYFSDDTLINNVAFALPAYQNELKDRVYYSAFQPQNNHYNLFVRNKLGDMWDTPTPLFAGGDRGNCYTPFVLTDGVTLYYASDNAEGLGGLDIYVTRYKPDTKQYMKAENLGMPFNSPANDYLMIIDEERDLGWFASDRRQPADSICIYLFIPNETRTVYPYTPDKMEQVRAQAQLLSIANTWSDPKIVKNARERYASLHASTAVSTSKPSDFLFVVNDQTVYTRIDQFRQAITRAMAEQWLKLAAECKQVEADLEQLRKEYSTTTSGQKQALAKQIVTKEQQEQILLDTLHAKEKALRLAEHNTQHE